MEIVLLRYPWGASGFWGSRKWEREISADFLEEEQWLFGLNIYSFCAGCQLNLEL